MVRKCPPGWGTLGQAGGPKPLPCLMGAKGPNPRRDPAGCQFGITRTLPWVKEPEAAEVPLGAPATAGSRPPRRQPWGLQPGRHRPLKILFTK